MKKKIIILGKASLGIKICEYFLRNNEKYEVLCVVPCKPDVSYEDESLECFGIKRGLNVVVSGNYGDINGVHGDEFSPDLVISVFYNKIIKSWFINKCKKIINIHFSFLPKYRGTRNINWALRNNEKKHGVTIHELTSGLDEGPIISQVSFDIYPDLQEVRDIYISCMKYAFTLFESVIEIIDTIVPLQQDHSQASIYFSKDNFRLGDRYTFTREESINYLKKHNDTEYE